MTTASILFVGLMLGMQHATEADHMAAVATLATRRQSLVDTLRLGAAWGIGHSLSLMLFAGAVFAFDQVIPPRWEQLLESGVGLMLILLGGDVLWRVFRGREHAHRHEPVVPAADGGAWPLRALAVGMMHGLAGSAALVVLSLQAAPSAGLGLGYIALFGVGSILGMALLSTLIAIPLKAWSRWLSGLNQALTALVGLFSCGLGLLMVL